MKTILFILLFSASVAHAEDLTTAMDRLASECTKERFPANFKAMEEAYNKTVEDLGQAALLELFRNESYSSPYLIADISRIFFPFEIPEGLTQGAVYMQCHGDRKDFLKQMDVETWDNWATCVSLLYNGKLPAFEKKVLGCAERVALGAK